MIDVVTKTQKVKIYPDLLMRNYIDQACDYRRYCFNSALGLWQDMYWARKIALPISVRNLLKKQIDDKSIELSFAENVMNEDNPVPNEKLVRNILVNNKEDWQDLYSARILQCAVKKETILNGPRQGLMLYESVNAVTLLLESSEY